MLADWDRSIATNAPGQSESPDSAHFADLARLWAAGEYFPLAFTEAAVNANAKSTLTLDATTISEVVAQSLENLRSVQLYRSRL